MQHPVADVQILRGVSATLTYQFTDADGEPGNPAGAVTIGIIKADGTTLIAAGTATTTPADTTKRTYSLAAVNTLELLTATWTDAGDGSTHQQTIDVVGGYYFSVAQARQLNPSVNDPSEYPTADIIRARREIEEQFETITGVAWVPRFRRVRLDGDVTSFALPDPMLRTIRSIRFYTGATTYTTADASQIAGVGVGDASDARAGVATRFDLGFWVVPLGAQSVVVEYEHGYNRPPEHLVKAAVEYLPHQLRRTTGTTVMDRATTYQPPDGGNMLLATPGRFGYDTGIPSVDAVLQRPGINHRVPGLA